MGDTITFYKTWQFWLLALLAVFLLTALFTSNREEAPAGVTVSATDIIYDVPLLVGKSVGEIEVLLGDPDWDKPPTALQVESGTEEWSKSWEKEGVGLMVTYEIATERVIELFVSKVSERADDILRSANLSLGDSRYTVELVHAKNAAGYTGAIVRVK